MDYENIPFPTWVMDQNFNLIAINLLAKNFAPDPFSGLDQHDVIKLKESINNSKQEKICLKWNLGQPNRWLNWHTWMSDQKIYFTIYDMTSYVNQEHYYQQILNAIPDMILVKGKDSHIRWANTAFQKHYGMSAQELDQLIDAPFQPKNLTEQYIKEDAWVWNNKKSLLIECETVLKFDGEEKKFQTIKAPILDQDGNVQLTVGVSRDITEQLEYQQKSYFAYKMASLGEMAGGIAHEINNPIGTILAKNTQIKRRTTDPKLLEDLEIIKRNALRVAKIVEALRNFCQEGDKQVVDSFSFSEVVKETLLYCQDRITRAGIDLRIEIPENISFIGKKVQISQIILNLLNNAVDAIENLKDPWIKISAGKNGKSAELRIQDSGTGISEEIEVKIMQPFFTTKDIGKGTGLGLSISLALATQNSGTLTLDRKTSASCFLLTLPIT